MSVLDLSFVDTNIFVYWLGDGEPDEEERIVNQGIARSLLLELISSKRLVISTQVLGEFFNAVSRKGSKPLSQDVAASLVRFLARFPVIETDVSLVLAAVDRSQRSRISYYDSLMIEAALRVGASVLYSEDMHHGTRYGSLEIRNPFPPGKKKKKTKPQKLTAAPK